MCIKKLLRYRHEWKETHQNKCTPNTHEDLVETPRCKDKKVTNFLPPKQSRHVTVLEEQSLDVWWCQPCDQSGITITTNIRPLKVVLSHVVAKRQRLSRKATWVFNRTTLSSGCVGAGFRRHSERRQNPKVQMIVKKYAVFVKIISLTVFGWWTWSSLWALWAGVGFSKQVEISLAEGLDFLLGRRS